MSPSLTGMQQAWSRARYLAHARCVARRGDDEAGSILILALIFLVAVSLIVLALLSFVGNSLTASASFTSERTLETAATSAVNLAIQQSRITFAGQMENAFGGQTTNSQPTACWFDSSSAPQQPPMIDGQQIDVWCSMIWQPYSSTTRTVTYSACPSTQANGQPETNVECAAAPTLQAVEVFDDYPPGVGVPLVNPVQCNFYGYCGQSMTQVSWQWHPNVPVVTSISPTSTTIAGGTPLTITGTGFVAGSSVTFTDESGGTASSQNVIVQVPASQVTASNCAAGGGCTTLSLTAPAVSSGIPSGSFGATYFVTVTTPGGTSQFVQPAAVLNYTTFTPTVTGISGTQEAPGVPGGSITGGSTVTISGTGFFNAYTAAGNPKFAAQVWFICDTATNSNCPGGNTAQQASNVNVGSATSLTASTPAVTVPGNWYVQVDTFGGQSAQTTYDFNYGVQVPIIVDLSPSSGPAGTNITINGGNFLSGTTVAFCADQSGNPNGLDQNGDPTIPPCVSASIVSGSLTSTTMTVTVPTTGLTAGSQYFPVITLPTIQGYSGPTSSQTYNEPADIFTLTTVNPTVNVSYPVNGTTYGNGQTWSGTITGTASSNSSGTISSAAVAIEDTSTNKWWNGTSFSNNSQTFVPASGTTSWTYSLPASKLSAFSNYSITGEATDSLNHSGTSSTVSFFYF
jgi:hypothetical protein